MNDPKTVTKSKADESAWLKEETGTDSKQAGKVLIAQTMLTLQSFNINSEDVDTCEVAQKMLYGISPQDPLEGMMAVQMVALHNMAMDCARRASGSNQSFEGRDMNMRHAARLMNAFTHAVETLDKHRGKGQTITVKHQQVTVESGGQAVIGDVNHGGKGNKKNE